MQKNHQNRPLDEAQKALIAQLKNITTSDYRRLCSRIHGLSNVKKSDTKQAVIAEIEQAILSAQAHFATRKTQLS